MTGNNVTSIEAMKLSHFITDEWLASYSDSGHVWDLARQNLVAELAKSTPQVIAEAQDLARERWGKVLSDVTR